MEYHKCKFKKTCKTLNNLYPQTTKIGKLRRKLREFTLISEKNCRKCYTHMGSAGYIYEKERQLNQYSYTIHPYSKFRQVWESLVILETLISLGIRLFVVSQLGMDRIEDSEYQLHAFTLDLFDITDEALKFVTGYVDTETKEIIMDLHQIYRRNIRQVAFYPSFIAALPFDLFFYLLRRISKVSPISRYIIFIKIGRLFKTYQYFSHLAKIYNWGTLVCNIILTTYNFLLIVHWMSCLFYMVIFLDDFGPPQNKFDSNDPLIRFFITFHMVYSLLFFQNGFFSYLNINTTKDMFFSLFFLLTMAILQAVIIGFLIQFYCFKKTPMIRFEGMVQEAQKFITQENIPKNINVKMMKYFEFRFHNRYFREKYILETLSPTLRREIANFLCLDLLTAQGSIFANISNELASDLCLRMKYEIFLAGDEVVREGKEATKMYFVSCGSFCVYSPRGNEIKHLYNGSQFGLSAFATLDVYIATVIALEISECYSLKYTDFLTCVTSYPEYINVVTNAADTQRKYLKELFSNR